MVVKYLDRYNNTLLENNKDLNKLFWDIQGDKLIVNNNKDSEETINSIINTLGQEDILVIKNIRSLGDCIEKALSRVIRLLNKYVIIKILDINLELRYDDEEKIKLLKSILNDCAYYKLN